MKRQTKKPTVPHGPFLKREELLSVLTRLAPGLSQDEIIAQSSLFIFHKDWIYTFNGDIAVSIPYATGILGALSPKVLTNILKEVREKTIELVQEEGKPLFIRSGVTKGELTIDTEIILELPFHKELAQTKWLELPENFNDALHFCLFSASKDYTHPILTNLCIQKEEVLSCDNFRLTSFLLSFPLDIREAILLPRFSVQHLVRHHKPTHFTLTNNWVHFKDGEGTIFSALSPQASYPEGIKDHFLNCQGRNLRLPSALKDSIRKVEILADSEFELDKQISLTIHNNKIMTRGEGPLGWLEDEVEIRYEGKRIEFIAHPSFLKDVLQHIRSVKVAEDRLLFKGKNFSHGIMLIVES